MKSKVTFLLFFICNLCFSQNQEIKIDNPSFEGFQGAGRVPIGWTNCNDPNQSPPDTQPGVFGVDILPQNGKTYLGLVTREDGTVESVGQKLVRPLEEEKCYQLTISLARSDKYESGSRMNQGPVNHNQPIQFNIWGGNELCSQSELLASTIIIENSEWQAFHFSINQKNNYDFLILSAFQSDADSISRNGNVIVDNMSNIQEIDCPISNSDSLKFFIKPGGEFHTGYDLKEYEERLNQQKLKIEKEQAQFNARLNQRNLKNQIQHNPTLAYINKYWEYVTYWENRKTFPKESKVTFRDIYSLVTRRLSFTKIVIGVFGDEEEAQFRRSLFQQFVEKDKKIDASKIRFEIIENPDEPIPWLGKNEFFGIRLE